MGAETNCKDQLNRLALGWIIPAACSTFMLVWCLTKKRPSKSPSAKKLVAQRVIGCFDCQLLDEEDGDFYNSYKNPQASVSGLKHSAEFQAHIRNSNLDVDKEEEKLLAYSTLRAQDLEGFKKLLSGEPEDYQEFTTTYLPLPVALLDYLFLALGVPLAYNGLFVYLCAWVTTHLCMMTSRPSIFSIWLNAKGYYVINQHNELTDQMRVACAWILEVIFVSYTGYWGIALSVLLKALTKKRQGLMEHMAGIWIIMEKQGPVQIL